MQGGEGEAIYYVGGGVVIASKYACIESKMKISVSRLGRQSEIEVGIMMQCMPAKRLEFIMQTCA